MIVVVQRVLNAKVEISDYIKSEISKGILCYVSYRSSDNLDTFRWVIRKLLNLRIFPNEDKNDRFDLSVKDVKGEVLVVSNFTLHGNCKKGLRPDFIQASPPSVAFNQHQQFIKLLRDEYPYCKDGEFGATMKVYSVNNGPVTILITYGEDFSK